MSPDKGTPRKGPQAKAHRLARALRAVRNRIDGLRKRAKAISTRRGHVLADLALLRKARSHGARYAWAIIRAARAKGIGVALGFALVEQESGFKNIFGCDAGGLFCHQDVTAARVDMLIRSVHAGGTSNGVGLTQLTSIGLIEAAERAGGAHRPRCQLSVGFGYLHDLIAQLGQHNGIGAFNGGPGNPIDSYADSVEALVRKWQGILN